MDSVSNDRIECRCDTSECLALRDLVNGGFVQHIVHLRDGADQFRLIGWER